MSYDEIKWGEIQDTIEDAIWCSLEIDADEIQEMLIEKLGFSKEDAEEMADNIYGQVMDAEDQVKLDLAMEITNDISNIIRDRDIKMYPEDAPGQMHLFEWEDQKDE